ELDDLAASATIAAVVVSSAEWTTRRTGARYLLVISLRHNVAVKRHVPLATQPHGRSSMSYGEDSHAQVRGDPVSQHARAVHAPRRCCRAGRRGRGRSRERNLRQVAPALRGESRPDARGGSLPRTRSRLQPLFDPRRGGPLARTAEPG